MKPSPKVFVSDEVSRVVSGNKKLEKWLADMKAVLLENMMAGDKIGKSRIPPLYIAKYGVHNLYHYELPEDYRSSYTLLMKEGLGVCPFIIDFMTHHDYNKKFGYD